MGEGSGMRVMARSAKSFKQRTAARVTLNPCPFSHRGRRVHEKSLIKQPTRTSGGHTVATGVVGEPTAPGRRKGGAVRKKRVRLASRSQAANSDKCQSSPSGT